MELKRLYFLTTIADASQHVGKLLDLSDEHMRKIHMFSDKQQSSSPPLSPKHTAPTPPFRVRPTKAEYVMFAANQRGGTMGTIAYMCKAVVRLVQNSVENEGVCYVS